MPVDEKILKQYVDEVAEGDNDWAVAQFDYLKGHPQAAAKFVGGFLGKADVTRKQMEVADERRKTTEERAQIEAARKELTEQLGAFEQEKKGVLKQVAQGTLSAGKARDMLKYIRDTYNLTDDDIPGMSELIETAKTGKVAHQEPVDIDAQLDAKLAGFKSGLMDEIGKKLIPQLSSLTDLDLIWDDIGDEHKELTGKRLTSKEKRELLAEAKESGRTLTQAWEDKFGVGDLRKTQMLTAHEKELREKWDKEQAVKASEDALRGREPKAPWVDGSRESPIFRDGRKMELEPDPVKEPAKVAEISNRPAVGEGTRSAERFLQRRAAGVPLGAKEPEKKTA